jgi:hypothetical protein
VVIVIGDIQIKTEEEEKEEEEKIIQADRQLS